MTVTLVAKGKSAAKHRREQLRAEFWPNEVPWLGPDEVGYFCAPRTLALILSALRSKKVRGNQDLGGVYLELLSRHWGEGIIEMMPEGDHAYAAGYTGTRAVRTWRERMALLEKLGFIQSRQRGNLKYGILLLVHPTIVIQRLQDKGQFPAHWWSTYRSRQLDNKEPSASELVEKRGRGAVRSKDKTA